MYSAIQNCITDLTLGETGETGGDWGRLGEQNINIFSRLPTVLQLTISMLNVKMLDVYSVSRTQYVHLISRLRTPNS